MTERGKRPHSAQVLERWAQEYATRHDLVKKRVQDWISYMELASKLESASRETEGPTFVIKGGVALEMRLRDRARATTDIDLIVEVGDAEDMVVALRDALEGGYQGFSFRVKDAPYPMEDGSIRTQVVLEYRERGWGTVQVDLSPREGHRLEREEVAPLDLGFFGLEPAEGLSCLSVRYHLAHKIHGMTKPGTEERPNDRVRDLLDVFLLRSLVADEELSDIREACVEVFEVRGEHDWPPELRPPEFWEEEFEASAERLGLGITAFDEAVEDARAYIERIDASG